MPKFPVGEEDDQEMDCHSPYMERDHPNQGVKQLHDKPKTLSYKQNTKGLL